MISSGFRRSIKIIDVKGVLVKLLSSRYDSALFKKAITNDMTIYIKLDDEKFTES
jgi:hypothetical protein